MTWPWKGHVNICHLNWLLQIDCTTGRCRFIKLSRCMTDCSINLLKICQNKKGQTFVWILFLQQSTDKIFKKGFKKRASQQRFDTSYFVRALLQTCKTEFTLKNAWVIDTPKRILQTTNYGRPVRKSPLLHGRKSTPAPKFLGGAEAYFVCQIGPNFEISLIYAFIGCP